MSSISRWSRKYSLEEDVHNSRRIWEHTSGQIGWITEKNPEGYYTFQVSPNETEFIKNPIQSSEIKEISSTINGIREVSAKAMRFHPAGFKLQTVNTDEN